MDPPAEAAPGPRGAVVTFALLGAFTQYRPVVYRVYTPPAEAAGSSRTATRIYTKFGHLAVTYAHLSPRPDAEFHIVLFAPPTLDEELRWVGNKPDLGTYTEELARKIVVESRRAVEGAPGGVAAVSLGEDASPTPPLGEAQCAGNRLPCIYTKPAALTDGERRWRGHLHLAVVPLVGAFKTAIYREHDDPGHLLECITASVVYTLRQITKTLKDRKIHAVLLDTTHGLNLLATAVARAASTAYPLIAYEWGVDKLYIYNSDPVTGAAGDLDISYYYQIQDRATTIRTLLAETATRLKKPHLLLLEYGLLPYALYTAATQPPTDTKPEIEITTKPTTQIKEIQYKSKDCDTYAILNTWLTSLLLELHCHYHDANYTPTCLPNAVCYDLQKIRAALQQTDCADPKAALTREILGPVPRLLWLHELSEFDETKLQYMIQLDDTARDSADYKAICQNLPQDQQGCKCLRPNKIQHEVRHVVAHAGLTGVMEDMAIILDSHCKPLYICLAKTPQTLIQKLHSQTP